LYDFEPIGCQSFVSITGIGFPSDPGNDWVELGNLVSINDFMTYWQVNMEFSSTQAGKHVVSRLAYLDAVSDWSNIVLAV
jgi:hypothetical protein